MRIVCLPLRMRCRSRVAATETVAFAGREDAHLDEVIYRHEYLEMVPHERLRWTDRFDDPNLRGEMKVTVSLKKVSVGTEVNIVQEGIPDVISPDACCLGWQESLTQLANLVEAELRRVRPS